jgi:hypothetical protein
VGDLKLAMFLILWFWSLTITKKRKTMVCFPSPLLSRIHHGPRNHVARRFADSVNRMVVHFISILFLCRCALVRPTSVYCRAPSGVRTAILVAETSSAELASFTVDPKRRYFEPIPLNTLLTILC